MADYALSLTHPNGGQCVRNRRWYFCRNVVAANEVDDLIRPCEHCGRFFARCCQHIPDDFDMELICHHFHVVYTDGACLNNGRRGAISSAGLGIAMGTEKFDQWAIPVDASVDGDAPRTSQRAELLAAIKGVKLWTSEWLAQDPETVQHGRKPDQVVDLILATDSEYVCKGMHEWYPKWKSNGWVGSKGVAPKNLDLFHELDRAVKTLELLGVDVGFLHLRRQYNSLADGLSKKAATSTTPVYFGM